MRRRNEVRLAAARLLDKFLSRISIPFWVVMTRWLMACKYANVQISVASFLFSSLGRLLRCIDLDLGSKSSSTALQCATATRHTPQVDRVPSCLLLHCTNSQQRQIAARMHLLVNLNPEILARGQCGRGCCFDSLGRQSGCEVAVGGGAGGAGMVLYSW
jgi:hypothetical protein